MPFLLLIVCFLNSLFRSKHQLVIENLALRQQVFMLRKSVKKPRPSVADKLFWTIFARYVDGWRKLLHGLYPDTVPGEFTIQAATGSSNSPLQCLSHW